ncbi:hypothetical protein OIO90_003850 [Microbotryomycetes sp. JL221]|nr:hypothetical protein OIO90_003850 [Microbotryomycetes sp. JL221]
MGAFMSSFGSGYVDLNVFPERCPGQTVVNLLSRSQQLRGTPVNSIKECCALCASPAINGGFTIVGLIMSTFASTVAQWINPTSAAAAVIIQGTASNVPLVAKSFVDIKVVVFKSTVLIANIYIFTVLGRWAFAVGGGVQQWHARHAFLIAGGSVVPLVATVFAEAHQIHGFNTDVDYREFLKIYFHGDSRKKEKHVMFPRQGDGMIRRLWMTQRRHKALFTSIFFTVSLACWVAVYLCISISKTFWQTNCNDLIDKHASPVLLAYSVAMIAAAFGVAVGLWIWSGLHYARWQPPTDKAREKRRPQRHLSPGAHVFHRALSFTRGYGWIRYGVPIFLFITWLVAVFITTDNAYRYFLTVNGTAFYFSCVQNLILGLMSLVALALTINKHGITFKQRRTRELVHMLRSELETIATQLDQINLYDESGQRRKNRKQLIQEILKAETNQSKNLLKGGVDEVKPLQNRLSFVVFLRVYESFKIDKRGVKGTPDVKF